MRVKQKQRAKTVIQYKHGRSVISAEKRQQQEARAGERQAQVRLVIEANKYI